MGSTDRLSYDTGTSQLVQGDIGSIASRLETVINDRDTQVSQAMSDFQADGVSDEYATVEKRWNTAAAEVKSIITLVRDTLNKNDESATTAQARAKQAVAGIG